MKYPKYLDKKYTLAIYKILTYDSKCVIIVGEHQRMKRTAIYHETSHHLFQISQIATTRLSKTSTRTHNIKIVCTTRPYFLQGYHNE